MVKKSKIALDTNIVTAVLKNETEVVEKLKEYAPCLPVSVCGEFLFGCKNSGKVARNVAAFKALAKDCEILTINEKVADEYSDIRKALKDKGKPIPENDVWIAATCRAYQVPLATRDKHFEEVEGLDLLKM